MRIRNFRVRPSSLALTLACHASLTLQESVPPSPPTDEKAEGTAAHWVARRFIAGYANELPVNAKFISEGKEWKVTTDMYAGAFLYAKALDAPHPDLHVEETVEIQRVHDTECGGTPDAWRFYPDARAAYPITFPPELPHAAFNDGRIKLLRIGDYKFGHRYVEVFENAQLVAYAVGVLDKLGLHDHDPYLFVELILVQPRSYHPEGPVRVWRTHASNLRAVVNLANMAADAALGPNPRATTGGHCLDCDARYACQALQFNTMRLVDFSHTAERVELPSHALGQELAIVDDAMELLKARRTGLAAQAEAKLRAGEPVPFYSMKPGRSNLTYHENVTADELLAFGDLVGVDLRRKLDRDDLVVTPRQGINLGIDESAMGAYASRPPAAVKLTRDSSTTVRKVFAK